MGPRTKRLHLTPLSRWPLFLSYTALLYAASVLPLEQMPEVVTRANDKVLHFIDFFLLALLAFRTLALSSHSFFRLQAEGKAILFSLFYGAFLEWAQKGAAGREASFMDWSADALGVLLAALIFRISKLTRPS